MAELLRINPDSRLDAVRNQLTRFRRTRVVLEVPDEWTELQSAARMRLIQRQAVAQQCQVAVVSRDAATVKAAQVVGIPTFGEIDRAMNSDFFMVLALPPINPAAPSASLPEPPRWQDHKTRTRLLGDAVDPKRHYERQERIQREEMARRGIPGWLSWVGYAMMGGLLLFMLALFGLYVLPAATVTVHPGIQPISVTTSMTANPNLEATNLAARQIKGRLVETIIEEIGVANTSGSVQKPTTKAVGTVTFSNLGSAPVPVPAGTIVSTGTGTPVQFRTVSSVEIPGGVGQRVDVSVEALNPGTEGNVRANTITNIDGPVRFRARVSNAGGTGGGGSDLVRSVTQADKDALLAETLARAEARADEALQSKLQGGEWLPQESIITAVVAQAFDQYNDDQSDQVNLTLRLLVQGVAVSESEARNVLQAAVQNELPENAKLVADSLVAHRVPGAESVGRAVEFTMTVTADYVTPVDAAEVRNTIAGKSEEEARQLLQQEWLLFAPPEFYRDPQWVATLPAIPSRIQVRIVYDEPVASTP